ncbi:Extradiol ring-cleavage dioxygenase, class III enzyme, subunit B [Schizothecium vesticola]|uniref:Extradiol ring-cleavage dioxygenase, class III enzyme, subunit B n=1 Tax=Schizothecium vesticola TaxID=314040 RepID=A0AA40F1Z2_9PEZI|nr:Extradiol ring-cleavage dioxygenase, class III enzyme, subunit B [Schizothecium vesticola]
MWRHLFLTLPIAVITVALLLPLVATPLSRILPQQLQSLFPPLTKTLSTFRPPTANMTRPPVYFLSHGGPDVQYNTEHPAYPILQAIGKEITQKVKPTAVVVFSAHWQPEGPSDEIHANNAEKTDLIYDFYGFPPEFYRATFPSTGSPALAARILSLLSAAGIRARALSRGLDHGVFSGFNVAFPPATNPLTVPLVQVSLFASEDPDAHHALGAAVASLRDAGVVIIGTGMTVHNLRDMRRALAAPGPMPYAASFDEALKEAVEAPVAERQARMRELVKRRDAREAHPWMDHLMPLYVAAGAAGTDVGVRTWTLQEASFAWGQYRFGEVPASS